MIAQPAEQIQADIIADIAATPDLSYTDPNNNTFNITNNTSKRGKWRLWTYVIAGAIATLEQLIDQNQISNEALIAAAIPETEAWLTSMVFQFQYSALNPQIIQLINLVPAYPVVDSTLCPVSRCNVSTTGNNQVLIKVATLNPPVAMSTAQVAALQDMINTVGVPGVVYFVTSGNADQIMIAANIYYQGQYSSVILNNTITALTTFLSNLSSQVNFNGIVQVSDIENCIRSVTGVNDVTLVNVQARADATPLADAVYLVQAQTLISRLWQTAAGYIIPETTTGFTLADTLNLIAE